MTPYHDGLRSTRNHYHDPPGLIERVTSTVSTINIPVKPPRGWSWKRVLTLVNFLSLFWVFALYRGERTIFRKAIDACDWDTWENWPQDAVPHHLVFIADPQLVDPHTYPGRPWPLSTLTVSYTDQYLRRAFSKITKDLYPDTVIFLGDLFDGGREWSTPSSASPEKQYKKYGDRFWQREYTRFGSIFFDQWNNARHATRAGQDGRKMMAGLPGNHDLGFATGIQKPVRNRFNAYFGDGNRIDVIANHTFVSVDSVSLSAQGLEDGNIGDISRPVVDFLNSAHAEKRRAITRHLRTQNGLMPDSPYDHRIFEGRELGHPVPTTKEDNNDFPTILLTHVPLYRDPGTPCGPLREHWPPTRPPNGKGEPPERDDRNAIAVQGGYQYQNVLTREILKEIAVSVGNIAYAFSGDDHDYCDVVHRGYPSAGGGIREITVKSMSWAMGVRKPGFVMLSMWNPVDRHGNRVDAQKNAGKPTIQTHLCLLPDQLGLFIRYALYFGITLLLLVSRAALCAIGFFKSAGSGDDPVLPMTEIVSSAETEKAEGYRAHTRKGSSSDEASSNSSVSSNRTNLSVRSASARTRSISPGGYGLPPSQSKYSLPRGSNAAYHGPAEDKYDEWGMSTRVKRRPKKLKGFALFSEELKKSVLRVALVALPWYFWLIWVW
ncbi:hypothetical protein W97_03467 [Coniosporium apollinis CBS 100218]|uniref:Calcineurin-like phosphoesterase domain-containing protein n=1 Tax=Coniosporium apollinis (strain CBS 100218) TaxID=1168221 RepID=R7YRG4_CONA1|nr:uncharacterized protein W97_03467 [Coniosporium apollinis CBS 100218]EON64236.1 hypothetical protein W97_03467 [Coniosporium apollinis CBS 100218]